MKRPEGSNMLPMARNPTPRGVSPEISARLRELRERHELTQSQAAEIAGLKDKQYWSLENARSAPSLESLLRLSKRYRVSLDDLVGP